MSDVDYNEAMLETLIGWLFFFSFLMVFFPPFLRDTAFTVALIKSEEVISFKL